MGPHSPAWHPGHEVTGMLEQEVEETPVSPAQPSRPHHPAQREGAGQRGANAMNGPCVASGIKAPFIACHPCCTDKAARHLLAPRRALRGCKPPRALPPASSQWDWGSRSGMGCKEVKHPSHLALGAGCYLLSTNWETEAQSRGVTHPWAKSGKDPRYSTLAPILSPAPTLSHTGSFFPTITRNDWKPSTSSQDSLDHKAGKGLQGQHPVHCNSRQSCKKIPLLTPMGVRLPVQGLPIAVQSSVGKEGAGITSWEQTALSCEPRAVRADPLYW